MSSFAQPVQRSFGNTRTATSWQRDPHLVRSYAPERNSLHAISSVDSRSSRGLIELSNIAQKSQSRRCEHSSDCAYFASTEAPAHDVTGCRGDHGFDRPGLKTICGMRKVDRKLSNQFERAYHKAHMMQTRDGSRIMAGMPRTQVERREVSVSHLYDICERLLQIAKGRVDAQWPNLVLRQSNPKHRWTRPSVRSLRPR